MSFPLFHQLFLSYECMYYTNCVMLVVLVFFEVVKIKLSYQWVCITNLEKSLLIVLFKSKEQIHWITSQITLYFAKKFTLQIQVK